MNDKPKSYYMANSIERALTAIGDDHEKRRALCVWIAEAIEPCDVEGRVHESLQRMCDHFEGEARGGGANNG